MAKPKCNVTKGQDCLAGKHQFIVSNWSFDATKQKANGFTCQFCLISVDGTLEVDKLKSDIHEGRNANKEIAKDL